MTETQQVTLADFLLARIAEDEAAARDDYFEFDDVDDGGLFGEGSSIFMTIGRRRVLAECEAKRRIVANWQRAEAAKDAKFAEPGSLLNDAMRLEDIAAALRDVAGLLALPYAGHEQFREDWLPWYYRSEFRHWPADREGRPLP